MTQVPANRRPQAVTGVHLMQGQGIAPAKGFWADAWAQVVRRPGAIFGLTWTAIISFFAVFAPLLASGRPILYNAPGEPRSPILYYLTDVDMALLLGTLLGLPFALLPLGGTRSARLGALIAACVQAGLTIVLIGFLKKDLDPAALLSTYVPASLSLYSAYVFSALVALGIAALFLIIPSTRSLLARFPLVAVAAAMATFAAGWGWVPGFNETRYAAQVQAGHATATWTLIPRSPSDRSTELNLLPPNSPVEAVATRDLNRLLLRSAPGVAPAAAAITPEIMAQIPAAVTASGLARDRAGPLVERIGRAWASEQIKTGGDLMRLVRDSPGDRFILGTDAFGQDVLSQMLHACRLAISIGLVSTGIAVLIGVTIGALMGYFGGFVDLFLYRVVEVFMGVPLLFLLILAAGVLPPEMRSTYVMMAIIGAFSWTGAARFTRAEFLRLRNQDFVQSCRAMGLPLRSILFRHMLPNGVTPVLVDASFAIAAAITIEATLSYLGLGPIDQASWGRLLASAYNQVGTFQWWLAIFPGGAIFLTVLSYNMIGEALRDAIDPKLKKARV